MFTKNKNWRYLWAMKKNWKIKQERHILEKWPKSGQLLAEGFEMAQDLNEYHSFIFTEEITNAAPLTESRFKGRDPEYIGKLICDT